jgi:hypothetical protein
MKESPLIGGVFVPVQLPAVFQVADAPVQVSAPFAACAE